VGDDWIGWVIWDNHRRLGIVVRLESAPSPSWLREQRDERVSRLGAQETWLGVMPLDGGLVVVPKSLSERLRPAARGDVLRCAEHTNPAGSRILADLFADRLAGGTRSSRDG
jgi:hypothetical protein